MLDETAERQSTDSGALSCLFLGQVAHGDPEQVALIGEDGQQLALFSGDIGDGDCGIEAIGFSFRRFGLMTLRRYDP